MTLKQLEVEGWIIHLSRNKKGETTISAKTTGITQETMNSICMSGAGNAKIKLEWNEEEPEQP